MVQIISRAEWGARPPRSVTTTTWAKRIGVAVHYSDGPSTQTPRQLQNYAMDSLGYDDTHYNFFVDQQGRAYEGRGWLVVAAHALNQNTPWIGVCFIGRNDDITDAAKATIRDLYDEACRLAGKTLQYSGHGQLPGQNTDCPGANLRAWIAAGMPRPNIDEGGDDLYAKFGDGDGQNVAPLEKVKEFQLDIEELGFDLTPFGGADGRYGNGTATGLVTVLGPKAGDGKTYGAVQRREMRRLLEVKRGIGQGGGAVGHKVTFTLPAEAVTVQNTVEFPEVTVVGNIVA